MIVLSDFQILFTFISRLIHVYFTFISRLFIIALSDSQFYFTFSIHYNDRPWRSTLHRPWMFPQIDPGSSPSTTCAMLQACWLNHGSSCSSIPSYPRVSSPSFSARGVGGRGRGGVEEGAGEAVQEAPPRARRARRKIPLCSRGDCATGCLARTPRGARAPREEGCYCCACRL